MSGIRKAAFWCAVVVVASGLGCASAGPGDPGAGGGKGAAVGPKPYACKDGRTIGIEKIGDASGRMKLVLPEGNYTVVAPVDKSGKRYGDGVLTLTFDGDAASVIWISGTKPPLQDCRPR